MKKGEKKIVLPPPAVILGEFDYLHFQLMGAPRTKKNSGQIVPIRVNGGVRHILRPSEAWLTYEAAVKPLLLELVRVGELRSHTPINYAIEVTALFYREADQGDLNGFTQGLGDLMQAAEVIADDVLIKSWDGSRLLKDAAAPRVEVKIRRFGAAQEVLPL
jgi:hypothetical protein